VKARRLTCGVAICCLYSYSCLLNPQPTSERAALRPLLHRKRCNDGEVRLCQSSLIVSLAKLKLLCCEQISSYAASPRQRLLPPAKYDLLPHTQTETERNREMGERETERERGGREAEESEGKSTGSVIS